MTDYRKLLLEACDLADSMRRATEDEQRGRSGYVTLSPDFAARIAEIRSLASSPPPDLEGPTEDGPGADRREAVTRLDRIESLCDAAAPGDPRSKTVSAALIAREVAPLLPLLRFWLEAEDQYEREKGLENTPATTLRKCQAADDALRAALRDSGGVP